MYITSHSFWCIKPLQHRYYNCLYRKYFLTLSILSVSLSGGKIGVMDAIVGQTLGGTLFSLLAGQPLIVIMTTAPIALYIKIIVAVAEVDKFFTGRPNAIMSYVFTGARHGLLRSVH